MEGELEKLREDIDEIDKKILNLVEDRVEIAKKIRDVKNKTGLGIVDSKREMKVLENVSSKTKIDRDFVKNLFKSIIEYCKNEERK